MGQNLSGQDLSLYRAVDEVLHYVWDPFGVSRAPEARGEYRAYLPQVFALVRDGAAAAEIAAHLSGFAVDGMGLDGNAVVDDLEVAELLVRWREVVKP